MFGSFVNEENPKTLTSGVKIELTEVSLDEDPNFKKFLETLPLEKQAELLHLLSWRRSSGFRS